MTHTLMNIIYSTGPSRCSTPVCSCPGGLVIRPSLSRVPSLKYVASSQDELDANNVLQYVGLLIEHDGYLARVLTVD